VLLLCAGCSLTVSRLDGEVETPAGPARTECEEDRWLVLAPTRAVAVSPEGTNSEPRRDSLGLYSVGGERPKSITRLERQGLGPSPLLPPHREGTRVYDRDRVLSASLGSAGMILMGVGAGVLASAFETVTVGGGSETEQRVNKGRGVGGAMLIGVGLGTGIGGLALAPTIAERTRAQAYRYTFVPENDPPEEVKALVGAYNENARAECGRGGDESLRDKPLGDETERPSSTDDNEAPAEEAAEPEADDENAPAAGAGQEAAEPETDDENTPAGDAKEE